RITEKSGVTFEKAYGYADRRARVAMDLGRYFDVGSITKQVTSAAILRLAGEGKLSLYDPLEKYLPGLPKNRAGINLLHLITHRSGIGDLNEKIYDEL